MLNPTAEPVVNVDFSFVLAAFSYFHNQPFNALK